MSKKVSTIELLNMVRNQIKQSEQFKRDKPEYYDRYCKDDHVLFIVIEKELAESIPKPKKISRRQCISCICADKTITYSDWWYCKNPKDFRDFTVLRDGCSQRPKWCRRGK